jgi:hypothetical protein
VKEPKIAPRYMKVLWSDKRAAIEKHTKMPKDATKAVRIRLGSICIAAFINGPMLIPSKSPKPIRAASLAVVFSCENAKYIMQNKPIIPVNLLPIP